jgi:hypothetical protein
MNFRIIKLFFICLIISSQLIISQEITQEQKAKMINDLDSISHSIRLNAILDIYRYKVIEALPKLENKIFTQEQDVAFWYLKSIGILRSSDIVNIAHRFIDTISYLPSMVNSSQDSIDINLYKIEAVYWLIMNQDFSKSALVFEYINQLKPKIETTTFLLLEQIIEHAPEFESQAKNELINIALSSEAKYYSTSALTCLSEKYNSEINPYLISIIDNNTFYTSKFLALKYLGQNNYSNLENFLKERFMTDSTIADIILEVLLINFPTPSNYVFIIENTSSALSQFDQQYYASLLQNYEPTPPKTLLTILEYVDYTSLLSDTLQTYNWLGDITFSNELKNILTTAKTNLQNGDSLACRVQVRAFQDLVDNVYKDSLNTDPRFVTIEGWKFLYWNAQYILDRLPELQANPNLVINLKNSLGNQIPASNVQYYEGSWKDAVNNGDGTFTVITTRPTVSIRVYYEYASKQADNVPAQNNTYTFQTVNATVQLKNSSGNLMPAPMGDVGTVQYYAGAWRSFGTTVNGVATKELLPINYSFRMAYEYGSIDKQQNLSVDPTVVFQTVNAAVQLKNSLGNLIDVGIVQYYVGAWRSFGSTSNGVVYKELLPINYSFRMTYEYGSIDKQQNLSVDPTVVFQTVNAAVQLKNSLGNLMPAPMGDVGIVQYYAGAWRTFGTTLNGVAYKELLPINYSFRMAYEYGSQDKQQNLSVDPTVVFQTVNAAVQLKNSLGNLIDQGTVQYYAGAWRTFGTTSNGVAYKELLPINYSFRMTYEFVSKDKQQNLSTNPVVDFNTVLCSVKVTNSTNQPLSNVDVKYYSGAWRDLGVTNIDGIATKELLPANLSFRASYGNVSLDKQQDISVNNLVEILLNIVP